MEDQWKDPLLLTEVSWHEQHSSEISKMAADNTDPLSENTTYSPRSLLGFSLTSPDLVICACSPDIPGNSFEETPDYMKKAGRRNMIASVEISLENGIRGSENDRVSAASTEALFPEVRPWTGNGFTTEASLELPVASEVRDEVTDNFVPVTSINAGGKSVICGRNDFQEDEFFVGGDVMRTEERIGDGEGLALYQTARFGNFLYKFQTIAPGNYDVDLYLAEIIFTDGPPGMRVFDVFIQEEKVVAGIDIYAQVGSNRPLVLSNLKAFVYGEEGISIRFEGVIGSPVICGISIRKDISAGMGFRRQLTANIVSIEEQDEARFQMKEQEPVEECKGCMCNAEREVWNLRRDYDLLCKEKIETKRVLEKYRKENELKSRECHEAWMSLQELQNELMRKSLHVGSLAYAVEGQVKEKSRWFSSLREVDVKFKVLKIEHTKLSEEAMQCRRFLADFTHMNSMVQSTVNRCADLEREHSHLKCKLVEEARERKELYNKVLELKGNIRVFCRCRPLNTGEIARGASMAIDFESAKDGELTVKANGIPKKVFKFDSVFSPQADQAEVFEDTAPLATSVLDGYNVCIFAYGQTGTGKTFTMDGTEEARGVNYRTLEKLFQIIREREKLFRYEISVSVLEVYNEQIRDLLVSSSQSGVTAKRLEIRQVAEGIHHIPGLVEAHVNNMNEVWEVLQTGSNARAVGSTNVNEQSSRSHCIHCVRVRGENLMNGECTRSKLWLVDLAGSERIAKTEVQGERLKETQNINKSLSALGDVISSLATKSPHIPFRNSKLTHLLQDSLGGDSKTLMFLQISPNENDICETLCSLNFASRVRGIELGPSKKQFDSGELSRYKQMVEKAKQDIKSKDVQIKRMEETIYNLESKMKGRDGNNKNLQEKVKELESQLLIERKLARQHVDTKIAEHQLQQQQQQQQQQNFTLTKPPLAVQQLGNYKHAEEPVTTLNVRPLTENNGQRPPLPPPTDNKYILQKENKPEISDQVLPKRTGRASFCTTARRIPVYSAPRRNSLAPFPTVTTLAPLTELPGPTSISPPLPLPLQSEIIEEDEADRDENDCPKLKPFSLTGVKSTRLNSILRRSLQKKVLIRSPFQQQHIRRGGGGGALEKVRVSIGGRGWKAQRVLVSNANRVTKDVQHKNQHKEKERGWNHGVSVRGVL